MENKTFLTVEQVAEMLQIHPNTVRNMIRRGQLEYYQVAHHIRIAPDAIDKLRVPAKTED